MRHLRADLHGRFVQTATGDPKVFTATLTAVAGIEDDLPGSVEEALANFKVTGNTYIAVVTRNVLLDRQILPQLVDIGAPYIGIIGSRRRWEETKRLLR